LRVYVRGGGPPGVSLCQIYSRRSRVSFKINLENRKQKYTRPDSRRGPLRNAKGKGAAGGPRRRQRATCRCRLQYTKIGLRASTNRITQNHPESRTCHERKLRLGLGLGPCALGLALGDDANRESSPVEHVNLNLICLKSVVIETRGSCRVSALAQMGNYSLTLFSGCDVTHVDTRPTRPT
jgi:hypothetical protein